MGTVYEAWDTSLDRRVAIKVLRPEISEDPETVTRFVREARAAAKVNHPNLGHIYFVGEERSKRFFTMEFVAGRTLDEHIEAEGPMGLEDAIDALVQAASGLAAAHEAGVIHRDVKPPNLKLLPDGTVKVLDFGLAKSLTGEVDVTGAGRILGTPRFMSPEQCRGEPLDWRTDLYCLGLLGWYLLAGEHAYSGDNLGKVLDDQMNMPLPSITAERPDLSPDVQRALERICAKRREDRPESMREAIDLLENLKPRFLDLAPITIRTTALLVDVLLMFVILGALLHGAHRVFGVNLHDTPWEGFGLLAILLLTQLGFEAWTGISVGKYLFNLEVVRQDGNSAGLPTLAARFLCRFPGAPLLPLPGLLVGRLGSLLQLAAILAGVVCYYVLRRRTLSDLLTRTRVVYRTPPASRERTN
jgi:serine/threonine-protein kinase